jgi:hypothetical protein
MFNIIDVENRKLPFKQEVNNHIIEFLYHENQDQYQLLIRNKVNNILYSASLEYKNGRLHKIDDFNAEEEDTGCIKVILETD